ncbi:hypothetical protein PG985_009571 [Apiospora marii]|uniref:Cellobiose dehydrogenase-like cytochrome domain-containing protein n=1 Tax=Apiospora marii TaxID=335849 RepID=A0ABR1RFP3_9PEZI
MKPSLIALLATAITNVLAAQYCDAATSVCYYEIVASGAAYRIAIPDVAAAPFDILLQIAAPKTVGWAGVAAHSMPGAYTGATYTVLKGSASNGTHWTLTALCRGCSQWNASGTVKSLDPAATAPVNLAYALSQTAPAQPANNASRIAIHSAKGTLALDMAAARTKRFEDSAASGTAELGSTVPSTSNRRSRAIRSAPSTSRSDTCSTSSAVITSEITAQLASPISDRSPSAALPGLAGQDLCFRAAEDGEAAGQQAAAAAGDEEEVQPGAVAGVGAAAAGLEAVAGLHVEAGCGEGADGFQLLWRGPLWHHDVDRDFHVFELRDRLRDLEHAAGMVAFLNQGEQ